MIFKNLEEELRQDVSRQVQEQIDKIEGNPEYAKRYATQYMIDKYNIHVYSLEDLQNGAIKCMKKDVQKDLENKLERLYAIADAPELSSFECTIAYDARDWNAKVRAQLTTVDENNDIHIYAGLASGGGYDRAATALAAALNQSSSVVKLLYEYKEKALSEGKKDTDRSSATGHWNKYVIAYGTGYDVLPEFEGGAGFGAITDIFNLLGWELKEDLEDAWNTKGSKYVCAKKETD